MVRFVVHRQTDIERLTQPQTRQDRDLQLAITIDEKGMN